MFQSCTLQVLVKVSSCSTTGTSHHIHHQLAQHWEQCSSHLTNFTQALELVTRSPPTLYLLVLLTLQSHVTDQFYSIYRLSLVFAVFRWYQFRQLSQMALCVLVFVLALGGVHGAALAGCSHDGTFYSSGSAIVVSCTDCTCQSGILVFFLNHFTIN